jgi:hypothetical protein
VLSTVETEVRLASRHSNFLDRNGTAVRSRAPRARS